jgi:hypothetical protein
MFVEYIFDRNSNVAVYMQIMNVYECNAERWNVLFNEANENILTIARIKTTPLFVLHTTKISQKPLLFKRTVY